MNPVTIAQGLEVVLQLITAIRAAQASGQTVITPDVWAAAIAGRKADQAKLDADIAKAKEAGL